MTIHSVLYRPPGTQTNVMKEEAGETLGSFILDGEHYGSVVFLDDRLASFRIPGPRLIRFMGPILHKCSFTPFSGETMGLKPFEHCVMLRDAFNSLKTKASKLAVTQERDLTILKSEEDFRAKEVAKKSAERVLSSFKGDYSKLPPPSKTKEKTKVTMQASGHFAEYLDAPLLDISRMHKEDNIQAVVSTPRASLILEEKEAREQLRRAVEFHEMFQQVASFLSILQQESSKHDQGSIFNVLKNFLPIFLCAALPLKKRSPIFQIRLPEKGWR